MLSALSLLRCACLMARPLAPLSRRRLGRPLAGSLTGFGRLFCSSADNSTDQRSRQRRRCELRLLQHMPYEDALALQRELASQRDARSEEDALLLAEHPAVYTLGRGSKMEHLKFDPDAPPCPLVRVERGGEVTYHGPGQLVAYPILDLQQHRKDLRWYVNSVEEVLIRTLDEFGVGAARKDGLPGVWVGDTKVGFVGISCSRWITMHGLSLNVAPDMAAFEAINPCGITEYPMGSMAGAPCFVEGATAEAVSPVLLRAFEDVFDLKLRLGVPGAVAEGGGKQQ